MKEQGKSIASIAILVLFGLSLSCDAGADSNRDRQRTNEQVKACIADIGKHADYAEAVRVVHWVDTLEQKNLVELEVGITTSVYLEMSGPVTRVYRSSCVAGPSADVVELRVRRTGTRSNSGE